MKEYATAEDARSATHCFYDFAWMCVHQEGLRETLPDTLRKYNYARARAVELGAEGIDEFPEDLVDHLRYCIANFIDTHPEVDKTSKVHQILTGVEALLEDIENSESDINSSGAN